MNRPPKYRTQWRELLDMGVSLIEQVNAEYPIITDWTFGGGTALMIQMDHRESHDIDLFLPDPQMLGYLNPEYNTFEYKVMPSEYKGDGSLFRKFAFKGMGEIDFIVAGHITDRPAVPAKIRGHNLMVETVPEVIAKKIAYRGSHLTPRDIFDVAAAVNYDSEGVVNALRGIPKQVEQAKAVMERLDVDFTLLAISHLTIRKGVGANLDTAIGTCYDALKASLLPGVAPEGPGMGI